MGLHNLNLPRPITRTTWSVTSPSERYRDDPVRPRHLQFLLLGSLLRIRRKSLPNVHTLLSQSLPILEVEPST